MLDYKSAGVDSEKKEGSLSRLLEHVTKTFDLNRCRPLLPIGYYANVIDLRPSGFNVGIAFSTDGVGTKLLVAEMMNQYDTIGIDCVAMNVNDLLCVGATPISMVDYIAISEARPELLEQVGKGLLRGCEMAGISLSGGELAQVGELLSQREGKTALDIVGTAIGVVQPDRILIGEEMQHGDLLIGLESNGLHSNGYTLARKICFTVNKLKADQHIIELGRTIGEELLRPTRIYVNEVLQILNELNPKALFHITGDGFLNLLRSPKDVSYQVDQFPPIPPVFGFLQDRGGIADEEMFRVFNMGIGFVIVINNDIKKVERIIQIAQTAGYQAHQLGRVVADGLRSVRIEPFGLIGRSGSFKHQ